MRRIRQVVGATRTGGEPLIARHEIALRLARHEAELEAIAIMVRRVAAMESDHSPAAHAMGSMLKIRGTELQQTLSEFMVELLGDYGAVAYPGSHSAQKPAERPPMQDELRGIAAEMFFRRASTIYGGTSEVQRGIIAKMLFQL